MTAALGSAFPAGPITKPGVYNIPAEEYHADPCPEPSLSSGVAATLVTRSPRHAWTKHPRLNPNFEPEEKAIFDLGKAAHDYFLESGSGVAIIEHPDWRTKAAKDERDAARVAGLTPVLQKDWELVKAMGDAIEAQLLAHREAAAAFHYGRPEQTLIWREGDIWCRARADWLPNIGEILDDLKTTGGSAEPDAWIKAQLFPRNAMQAVFYMRGAKAVLGWKRPKFRFVVVENKPPHALSVIELGPEALALAEGMVERAIGLWTRCLAGDRWPGYPARTCYADAPSWFAWAEGEKQTRDQSIRDQGDQPFDLLTDWQRPLEQGSTT